MSDIAVNTTLAILAGGQGSRMGQPKGLLTISGRPILQHILEQAQWPGPTLLVTSPGRQSPPASELFDAEAPDPIAGLGPMRGVLTALEHATTPQVIVSPVDMPSVSAELLRWLAEELHQRPTAIALMIERFSNQEFIIEPLPAAFRKSAQSLLQQRLTQGKASLHQLIDHEQVQLIRSPENWPPTLWTNLNFPDDMAQWTTAINAK